MTGWCIIHSGEWRPLNSFLPSLELPPHVLRTVGLAEGSCSLWGGAGRRVAGHWAEEPWQPGKRASGCGEGGVYWEVPAAPPVSECCRVSPRLCKEGRSAFLCLSPSFCPAHSCPPPGPLSPSRALGEGGFGNPPGNTNTINNLVSEGKCLLSCKLWVKRILKATFWKHWRLPVITVWEGRGGSCAPRWRCLLQPQRLVQLSGTAVYTFRDWGTESTMELSGYRLFRKQPLA